MKKLRMFFSKSKKKIAAGVVTVIGIVSTAISSFAAGEDVTAAVEAAKSVQTSLTSVLNVTNIAAILAACIGAAGVLFLAWWGVRKVVKVTVNAFAKGKLSI